MGWVEIVACARSYGRIFSALGRSGAISGVSPGSGPAAAIPPITGGQAAAAVVRLLRRREVGTDSSVTACGRFLGAACGVWFSRHYGNAALGIMLRAT